MDFSAHLYTAVLWSIMTQTPNMTLHPITLSDQQLSEHDSSTSGTLYSPLQSCFIKYHAPDTQHDSPPSHINLTPGQPVLSHIILNTDGWICSFLLTLVRVITLGINNETYQWERLTWYPLHTVCQKIFFLHQTSSCTSLICLQHIFKVLKKWLR